MKNELYFPVRRRNDGSFYSDKNCFWKAFLNEFLVTLLIATFFIGATLLILLDPFNLSAPHQQDLHIAAKSSTNRF